MQCLLSLTGFKFVLTLQLFSNLSKIHGVYIPLKLPTNDFSVAADLVQTMTATSKDVRDDSNFMSGIVSDATTLCEK